jgi:hypothetical protein
MTPTPAIAPVVSHEASAITAPTRFIETRLETYAYVASEEEPPHRLSFCSTSRGPWTTGDPAVTDQLAGSREVILFESAGVKMFLVGTAPAGGEDIMHPEKPELRRILEDPSLSGPQILVQLFFTPSESSQAAGQAFVTRLAARTQDREPVSGPKIAQARIAAFRAGSALMANVSGSSGGPCSIWW